jgi:hypothetical protein
MIPDSAMTIDGTWWMPHRVPSGRTLRLSLGPLTLRLHRSGSEWLLSTEEIAEAEARPDATLEVSEERFEEYVRYVYRDPQDLVTFRPMLADRPMVVRPRQAVYVLPGEETVFYISTPVWVGIVVGEKELLLHEMPVSRPSDTWFGPSTLTGEICYAARTQARNVLAEVPLRAYRVVTALRIENRADTPLPVEKLSLPVPFLSMWGRSDGSLWSDTVHLQRVTDSDMAAVRVEPGPPAHAKDATLLAKPRMQPSKGSLVRAFSGLFS